MKNEPNEQFVEKLTVADATIERTGTIAELKEQRESDNQEKGPASKQAASFAVDDAPGESAFSLPEDPDEEDPDGGGDIGKSLGGVGDAKAEIYYKGAKLAAKVLKGVWDVIKDSQHK
jgi:hypothetical protein